MKHSRSSSEWEIREAVVKRFRELWPDARIIHEMNVEHGSSRADVVAVQPTRLWICEIKSERDKLDRLAGQLRHFGPACHGMIVAAHEKWTIPGPGSEKVRPARGNLPSYTYQMSGRSKLDEALAATDRRCETWVYPEPESKHGWRHWCLLRDQVPWYHRMLTLLWADEMRAVAADHRVAHSRTTPAYKLAPDLSRLMRGDEIEKAVCRMLRARPFAEADAPVGVAA